ncbi:MAG: glycosyltransferase family 2 protein [Chitinophagaceae bacterium]
MYRISAVIITFNEEQNLARCITSLQQVADEIVVLDSFSSDRTVPIAQSMGARVYQEKFRGYIGQKNLAMKLASYDYILSLDADEELDERLIRSVREEKNHLQHRLYCMNRCTNYCGHFIRRGLWYPDKKTRLFDRRIARWGGLNPHDKIIAEPGYKPVQLSGEILHYSFRTPEDLVWQNNRLSSIAAASLYAAGKRSNWYRLLVHPAWAFLNGYFFRGGFLDGADGFMIAAQTAHQVFLKYSKLYRLQKTERNRKPLAENQPAEEMMSAAQ